MELLSSEGDMAEQIISINIGCRKMKMSSEGCMNIWEQVMEPGGVQGGPRGGAGRDPYLPAQGSLASRNDA